MKSYQSTIHTQMCAGNGKVISQVIQRHLLEGSKPKQKGRNRTGDSQCQWNQMAWPSAAFILLLRGTQGSTSWGTSGSPWTDLFPKFRQRLWRLLAPQSVSGLVHQCTDVPLCLNHNAPHHPLKNLKPQMRSLSGSGLSLEKRSSQGCLSRKHSNLTFCSWSFHFGFFLQSRSFLKAHPKSFTSLPSTIPLCVWRSHLSCDVITKFYLPSLW